MGRITKEQKQLIESFSCERLSHDRQNQALIKNFTNERGVQLVRYLQRRAWDEDVDGRTAHYLIKTPDGEVALYFSLKCGSLFNPLNESIIKQRKQRAQDLLQIMQGINREGIEREQALQLLEQIRSGRDIPIEQIKQWLKMNAEQAQRLLADINQDKEREGNGQIIRVGETYPGIDLVNFCANDLVRDKWKSYELGHPMGEVMFWKYIAPIMYNTQKSIGCQYAYLFAADASEDGVLINYYNVALKF